MESRPGRLARVHAASVFAVLAFAGVAVACAKGESANLGADSSEAVEPAEPTPSQALPSSDPSDKEIAPAADSSGKTSSGGTSSGGTSSGGTSSGGTSSGGSSSGGSSSGGTGGCATVPPSNACGLSPQCGCAANQTCDVTGASTGAVSCVSAGSGSLGSSCTATTQCGVGLACRYGACRPFCANAGAACTGAGVGTCQEYYDPTSGAAVPNSSVCSVTCDLRSPSTACSTNNCIFDTTLKTTDCDKSGTKGLYAACTRYNDCQQGLGCASHPTWGLECEKWCRLGSNDCGLSTCTDVYGAAAPTSGGVKLGHCQ